jgi:hypothetical protein
MTTIRTFATALLLALLAALPVSAQTGAAVRTLSVGAAPGLPDGTSVRLDGLGTSGGTNVLFADSDGDIFERLLGVSDIPSAFVRRDVAETINQAWTFSAGITGPLSVTTRVTTPEITTSAGNLTLKPAGDLILDPTGLDILPATGYTRNLGALSNKYLTLHAAELWVETLVAQNTIATIGGRVLVGPTTTLTADLGSGATSIVVKHNQIASGDRVYLEADGKVEFLAVTSGASGTGPYTYSVTRNLDGSGANDWYAGDAVFNTGTTGDGFIDLYSVAGVLSGNGPTIVGNVRTGTTYNQVAPRWAIGNLNNVYGYSGDVYGAAFGDAADVWLGVDATNGIRIFEGGSTLRAQWAPDGTLTIGSAATNSGNVQIASNAINLRSGTTTRLQLAASNGEMNLYDPGGVPRVTIGSGYAVFGRVDTGQPNVFIDPSAGSVAVRSSTTNRILLSGSNGAIQMYAPDSTRRMYMGDIGAGVYGLILGDSSTAGEPFVQIDESTMQFCAAGLGCTLSFNGTTGNMTSTGNLALNGTASIGSGVSVGTSGYVRSGTTTYGSGTGFFLGDDGGTYKFRIGTTAGNRLAWDGSTLTVVGNGAGLIDLNGGNLQAGTVTATQIASSTITASQIASGTITATQIASGTITADRLNVSTLSAIAANLGTVTAGALSIGNGSPYQVGWTSAGEFSASNPTFNGTATFNGAVAFDGPGVAIVSIDGPVFELADLAGGGTRALCVNNSGYVIACP